MTGGQHHHHPWRAFRAFVGWTLHWRDLPEGLLGFTDHGRRHVVLTLGMTQAERRSTIAHETAHVERGPVPPWMRAREERMCDAIAARRLVKLEHLADAMVWSRDEHEIAEECWVDVDTIRARLASLSPDERTHIEERLDAAGLA